MNRLWLLPPLLALLVLVACTRPAAPAARPDGVASRSSPIALSQDGRWLWVVNPDADSVTRVDTSNLEASAPIPVGDEPWGVALTPAGDAVVLNRADGSLSLLRAGGRNDIPVGPEPGGVALSPTGRLAYVTVSARDELLVVDLETGAVVDRHHVGRAPWELAVSDDGDADDDDETVVVGHRFARLRPGGAEARDDGKEAWLTRIGPDGRQDEIVIAPYAFGFPNVLGAMALQGELLLVPHLLNSPELPPEDFDPEASPPVDSRFETSVSGGLSAVDLSAGKEIAARRLHINEEGFSTPVNFPAAVALAPGGERAYIALAGTDTIMGVDLADPATPRLVGFWRGPGNTPVGANPRGLVLNGDGSRAYVMNFLDRTVAVLDLADEVAREVVATVQVTPETLEPQLLRGKILFHNANEPRLSHLGWISCVSCHPEGGSDTTTWIGPGEGARQTMALFDLEGTAPFHISATRDEVQDFEENIEGLMDGVGLAPGRVRRLLGDPNGGISADLDALAAYVLRGIRTPRAPNNVAPEAVSRGRALFAEAGCAGCHGGPKWTSSSLPGPVGSLAPNGEQEVLAALRDVGTFDPASDELGAGGFDVPSLLGLYATAPYLHDGSAPALADVLASETHAGRTFSTLEQADLIAFLRSIDGTTAPLAP